MGLELPPKLTQNLKNRDFDLHLNHNHYMVKDIKGTKKGKVMVTIPKSTGQLTVKKKYPVNLTSGLISQRG